MKSATLKPLNPRSPDTKYVGEEPLWREQPTQHRFTSLSRAFNWYNYFYGKKDPWLGRQPNSLDHRLAVPHE